MGVESRYHTIVHHEDTVAVFHARDALGDDDLRHIRQLGVYGFSDLGIRRGVTGRGGVVEHQYLRFFQQRTGDAEALFLSAAHVGATLFYTRVVALGHLVYELIGTGHLAGSPAVFLRGLAVAPAQVVEDGAREEDIVLQHHTYGIPQSRQVVFFHVPATHQYFAFSHVVEA